MASGGKPSDKIVRGHEEKLLSCGSADDVVVTGRGSQGHKKAGGRSKEEK